MSNHDEEQKNRQCPWSQMLPELLTMICHQLHPIDVPRFRAVCKHWNSCGFPVYPADTTPILISDTITDSGLIRCYSPYLNKMFIVRTPLRAPKSRIFSVDANGWAMLRGPGKAVSLGNLLDGSTFELTESEFDGGYFCSSHEDGTGDPGIFGVYAGTHATKFQSWNGESSKFFEGPQSEFTMTHCKPVLHKGLWHCLGAGGRLGVYDPVKIKWSIFNEPSFGSELAYKHCYLVESQEELLAVLTGVNGTPIYVLRLNETEVMWETMESLGSRAIFTGTVTSRSMDKPPVGMANKVYLPKFYGRPQVIPAELIISGGCLGFVPKESEGPSSNEPVDEKDGAWSYDLELDSGVDKEIIGCKNLMQYIWVNLGRASL